MSAKLWKSLSSIAFTMVSVLEYFSAKKNENVYVEYLGGTEYSALYLSSSLVFTLFLIPTELEVFFCMSDATQMSTLIPGQWLAGASCVAILSTPSSLFPMCHLTNPPRTDLQAEPDPLLARAEISPCMPYSLHRAATRQAYPAALLARPAAVGKLFSEQI